MTSGVLSLGSDALPLPALLAVRLTSYSPALYRRPSDRHKSRARLASPGHPSKQVAGQPPAAVSHRRVSSQLIRPRQVSLSDV
jgi:hypothetical protein